MQSLSKPSLEPGESDSQTPISPTAFLCGKLLIGIVVGGSLAAWLQDALGKLPWWYSMPGKNTVLGTGVVLGLLCWSALRGGRVGGGFFILVFSFLFLGSLAGRINEFSDWLPHTTVGFHLHVDIGGSGLASRATFSSVAADVWIVFSLWVLLFSKSARLYRETRRDQIATKEANAFEWPPVHRS